MKHPGGRPTKYRPIYCKLILEYFDIPPVKDVVTEIIDKKTGELKFEHKEVANKWPTLFGFARKIGVDDETLIEWGKVHPEFSAAIKKAKSIQQDILVENALHGRYEQPFAIFAAKNIFKWTDKTETDITSKGKQLKVGVVAYNNGK